MFKKDFAISLTRDTFQNIYNNIYPEQVKIKEFEDLKNAAKCDHVVAIYQNNHRSIENFLYADCIVMDVDNSESDNKEDWIDLYKFKNFFPGVEFYVIYSRNNDKLKKGKSPRPRFHVYFPLNTPINDAKNFSDFKDKLFNYFPAFDKSAKDAARFIFGVDEPRGLPCYGNIYIDEFLAQKDLEVIEPEIIDTEINSSLQTDTGVISEGERNAALYKIALKALMNNSFEDALAIFSEACKRCEPPLPENEIKTIWKSAQKANIVQRKNLDESKLKKAPAKKICSNDVSKIIKSFNIQARLNIITGKAEVKGLPLNSPFISDDFKILPPDKQFEHAPHELKIFLISYLIHEGYLLNLEFLKDILAAYFSYHEYNPVLEMLQGVNWDGQNRIKILGRMLNIIDNEHYMNMLTKWLIQAVAILHNDGNNSLDFVLTLQGRQGLGKTEFFRIIGMRPDWVRTGKVIDMNNKDSIIQATSCWICEIGELDNTLKKEQTSLKAFITQTVDSYRRPYAAEYEDKPRRTCFGATVNDEKFLRDTTGNRRWVVIPVGKIDDNALRDLPREWLCQLWRQAYELYLNGATYRLTKEERERNEIQNQDVMILLPGEQEILEGLNWEALPELWRERTASDLRASIPALKNTDVRHIGRALKKIADDDKRISVRKVHNNIFCYYLPPTAQ